MARPDLTGAFTVQCPHGDCRAHRTLTLSLGMGLAVGDPIPLDPCAVEATRCHRCHRGGLVITAAPSRPEPAGPRGFTRVPER